MDAILALLLNKLSVRTSPDAAANVRHRCGGGARAAQILGGASEDGACLARAMRRRRTCSLDFSGVSDSGGASCAPRDDYLAEAGLLALEERARRLLGGGGAILALLLNELIDALGGARRTERHTELVAAAAAAGALITITQAARCSTAPATRAHTQAGGLCPEK